MAVNKSGIYQLLENRLKAAGETPMTCGELYEFAEIRELARDDNSVVLDFEQFTITVQRKG